MGQHVRLVEFRSTKEPRAVDLRQVGVRVELGSGG
jgi:hypothetical protein